MRRAYRCLKCHELLGYVYDEEIGQPLPPCPRGHATELVPETRDWEIYYGVLKDLNLQPSANESQAAEKEKDPHTYRQRLGKQKNG